jgi:hypothetical protein
MSVNDEDATMATERLVLRRFARKMRMKWPRCFETTGCTNSRAGIR